MTLTSEQQFYADKAALLDPACCIYHSANAAFSITESEPVYLLNCWQATLPSVPGVAYFHRKLDVENAVLIPPGYALGYSGAPAPTFAYVYYAKPSLVQASDARYTDDPKALYYDRLARLRTLPLYQQWGASSQNQTAQWIQDHGYNTSAFPADFERGLIAQVSTHNVAWMTLQKNGANPQQILATMDELDDIRPARFTSKVLAPFNRSTFPNLFVAFGSMTWTPSGNPLDPIQPVVGGVQTYPGIGSVLYYKLPADW